MRSGTDEQVDEYRLRLRGYSDAEVEQIYFTMQQRVDAVRFRFVLDEMRRRDLRPLTDREMNGVEPFDRRLRSHARLRRHPALCTLLLALLSGASSSAVALALLAPVWLFVITWNFVGTQAALVYLGYLPLPIVVGADAGRRVGGRGLPALAAVCGVVAALLLFNMTGAPHVLVQSLAERGSAGGPSFSF